MDLLKEIATLLGAKEVDERYPSLEPLTMSYISDIASISIAEQEFQEEAAEEWKNKHEMNFGARSIEDGVF